jgi:hypothetical protein
MASGMKLASFERFSYKNDVVKLNDILMDERIPRRRVSKEAFSSSNHGAILQVIFRI